MPFPLHLTSFAVILWSGMLIIAGSIWVLSSQVTRLANLMEEQARVSARDHSPARRVQSYAATSHPREPVRRNHGRPTSRRAS